MFEPFFTTKPKGSGLGLATSYSIVKNHGGRISLDSEPGKGAIFHIYLPAIKKRAPVKRVVPDQHMIKGHGNILVMDDDDMIKTMLCSILTLAGYRVTAVSDGAEAVEKYVTAIGTSGHFDAVIMDLTIPGGMGGQEAVKKLLEADPDAKVIVSSGYSTDPIMADYKKYGFYAVVDKPYTAEKIEKTLHNVLARKKPAN
jgi:two-component system, cell cycle sensor histidine kinase and response regulator CckA